MHFPLSPREKAGVRANYKHFTRADQLVAQPPGCPPPAVFDRRSNAISPIPRERRRTSDRPRAVGQVSELTYINGNISAACNVPPPVPAVITINAARLSPLSRADRVNNPADFSLGLPS
jgi:hypothetical protein